MTNSAGTCARRSLAMKPETTNKTKMKYQTKHSWPNPRNNETVNCDTKSDALSELRKMTSGAEDGESVGTSTMFKSGEPVAFRDWNKTMISWM